MFTGIIEELGSITRVERSADAARITVRGPIAVEGVKHGDSIAVSGVCLTVVDFDAEAFTADVMAQTLRMSTLDGVAAGDSVNLERAARVGDRLGGHIVQGHVDGLGAIRSTEEDGFARVVTITAPAELLRYVVEKGSIAVNGVSLTVVEVTDDAFSVSLIPETLERTTLGAAAPGAPVNLEVDVVAKYVEKLVAR